MTGAEQANLESDLRRIASELEKLNKTNTSILEALNELNRQVNIKFSVAKVILNKISKGINSIGLGE